MRDWKLREVLLGGGIIAAFGSLLVVHGGIRLGTPIFGGDTGVFDAILGLLTLIALIAGGIGAFFSYRAALDSIETARVKDEWEQFRSGVQMLGADTDAEAIAGVEILNHLGEASADKFELLIVNVLRSYANELSTVTKADVWTDRLGGSPWPQADSPEAPAFIALGGLASQISEKPSRTENLVDGRVVVTNILLVDRVIYSCKYRNLHADRIAIDRVVFRGCDFTGAKLVGRARSVTFENCNLTNADIQLQRHKGGEPPHFDGCKIDGARFFGMPLGEWVANQPS